MSNDLKILSIAWILYGTIIPVQGQIVINEVSQGPNGSKEYVEFFVLPTPCASSCLDLRLWVFDDNNGFLNGGPTTGVGIAPGACRFANDAFWSCIPSGTLITIYNDLDPNSALPSDDLSMIDGNCNLVIPISSALFEHHPTEPSSTSSTYPVAGWLANGVWLDISMANSQDGFQIYDPANLTTPVFSIGWGAVNVNGDIYMGSGSAGDDVFYADNSIDCDFTVQGNWAQGCADPGSCGSDSQTPAAANNAANAACIGPCSGVPPLVIDSISAVNISCFGICDGSATVFPSGGALPYTYAWNDPFTQTDSVATGLCAGTWTVTVTEAGGCQDTLDSIVIIQPTLLVSSAVIISIPLCFGDCTGSALASAVGGTSPYTYAWNTSPVQTNALASGLCVGTYIVTVTDVNGCTDTSSVVITEPLLLVSSAVVTSNPLCFGDCTGSATASAVGGTSFYTYAWNTSPVQTNALATGLCAGAYIVTATDVNSCTDTSSVLITEPALLVSSAVVTTNPLCFGDCTGSATASGTGGTSPYTYAWNTSP
ncbi:MAG: SprB repeat-containing protein, partial [Flavobacteriales bacterium]|nr:SprB repeat-containing protein [Flavobacteriales bacterium]